MWSTLMPISRLVAFPSRLFPTGVPEEFRINLLSPTKGTMGSATLAVVNWGYGKKSPHLPLAIYPFCSVRRDVGSDNLR
jgi:hypothetical protein